MARLVAGESERAVASALDVAPSSVVKWSQRLRETGSCAPAGTGGHPPRKIVGAHEAWLLDRIRPAFTLRGLVLELAERGSRLITGPSGLLCIAPGIRSKKTQFAEEQNRPDVSRRRERWKRYQRLDMAQGASRE